VDLSGGARRLGCMMTQPELQHRRPPQRSLADPRASAAHTSSAMRGASIRPARPQALPSAGSNERRAGHPARSTGTVKPRLRPEHAFADARSASVRSTAFRWPLRRRTSNGSVAANSTSVGRETATGLQRVVHRAAVHLGEVLPKNCVPSRTRVTPQVPPSAQHRGAAAGLACRDFGQPAAARPLASRRAKLSLARRNAGRPPTV